MFQMSVIELFVGRLLKEGVNMRLWVPVVVVLLLFVVACDPDDVINDEWSSDDKTGEGGQGEDWDMTLEGAFQTDGLITGRGDMKVSLFPEDGSGLAIGSFAYRDGYLFAGSHEGSYTTEWSGTATASWGVFHITIPSRYTEPTIVLAWADALPIGTFDINVERSQTDWNSLLRLSNGDILGAIRFDGARVFYQTWIEDPVDGPHEEERELTADLYTDLTLVHSWNDPL